MPNGYFNYGANMYMKKYVCGIFPARPAVIGAGIGYRY